MFEARGDDGVLVVTMNRKGLKYMAWSSGCNSWYLSSDGSNHALYPGFAGEYALRARRFRPSDYEIAAF